MTTVRDIIFEALLMLGVVDAEGPIDATTAAGGLRALNTMVDGWNLEDLLVYTIDRQIFPLTTNVQTYTIGPGGTYNTTPLYGVGTPRPVAMPHVSWQQPSSGLELPLGMLSEEEYEGLTLRTTPAAQPLSYYYRPSFPLGELFVWPSPTVGANLVLWLGHPWDRAMTLDTVVSLPPGYQYLMETNLAVHLSARYPGTTPPLGLALDAKAKVKGQNQGSPRAMTDIPRHTGTGDMYAYAGWLAGRA